MTPDDMARIHAQALSVPPPWSRDAFADTLAQSSAFLFHADAAFALGRVILDEAELLTLAVSPDRWRQGLGRACLAGFEVLAVERGAGRAFLEVATTNARARALYTASGWQEDGCRPRYYRVEGLPPVDAILMSKQLGDA